MSSRDIVQRTAPGTDSPSGPSWARWAALGEFFRSPTVPVRPAVARGWEGLCRGDNVHAGGAAEHDARGPTFLCSIQQSRPTRGRPGYIESYPNPSVTNGKPSRRPAVTAHMPHVPPEHPNLHSRSATASERLGFPLVTDGLRMLHVPPTGSRYYRGYPPGQKNSSQFPEAYRASAHRRHSHHTVPTPSPHRPHTVTTPSPHRPHTVPTPSPHRHHTIPTPSPHRSRIVPTPSPHIVTTPSPQSPHHTHTVPTSSPHRHHTVTTPSPHRPHTVPTLSPHHSHTVILMHKRRTPTDCTRTSTGRT